ncbi:3-hydroxy-fatty acyl-ACP dehydratase [Acerihabitans sp. TG2]|uniref:ApeP family dehydratase n=1 Tax=Acerihabitans sp. TG2 TaxID=3096008 RepID=UPI002B235B0A|nr:3-hydroxy-fatty acyl-ACP dehydratase [Acerihabitans sp. TG2]MEA9390038.1 3-hydroxy-fatty acyl-ACP dehydratase [Acerihabitans sp. TG2]
MAESTHNAKVSGKTCYCSPGHYLPHAAPMILLEQVCDIGVDHARCRVTLNDTGVMGPFLTLDGHLPGWYAIEMMAQTVGVWSGWHGRHRGEPPRAGLLLGARALHCVRPFFNADSVLDISISLLLQDERIGSFDCVIQQDEDILATGRLTTYQTDENEIFQLLKD